MSGPWKRNAPRPMTRLEAHPCDFCGADSFEWYQTACHGCGEAFCRCCAATWPHDCNRCKGPAIDGGQLCRTYPRRPCRRAGLPFGAPTPGAARPVSSDAHRREFRRTEEPETVTRRRAEGSRASRRPALSGMAEVTVGDRCLDAKSLSTGVHGALRRDDRVIARSVGVSGRHTRGIMEHLAGNGPPGPSRRFLTGIGFGPRAGATAANRDPAGPPRSGREAQKNGRFRFLAGNTSRTGASVDACTIAPRGEQSLFLAGTA